MFPGNQSFTKVSFPEDPTFRLNWATHTWCSMIISRPSVLADIHKSISSHLLISPYTKYAKHTIHKH